MSSRGTPSTLFGPLDEPDYSLGERMAIALGSSSTWKHRKVESLRLRECDFGRRRVSLDLTPDGPRIGPWVEPSAGGAGGDREEPSSEGTAPADTASRSADGTVMLLPLALLAKQPLRDFDVSDASGEPLPVLGRRDDGFIAWSVLAARYTVDLDQDLPDEVLDALHRIVHDLPTDATEIANSLLSGSLIDPATFDPSRLDDETKKLTQDLASNFLLVCLLHRDFDRRQLVKYSSHWQVQPPSDRQTLWGRLCVGLGTRSIDLDLLVEGAADAGSYHLEVHAVPGMHIHELELPAGSGQSPYLADRTIGVIGHAVESYNSSPEGKARLALRVPRGGDRTVALMTTLFTVLVFWLDRTLSGAHCALLESADGAAALLLIIPAAFSLALSRASENVVLSHMLFPLRMLTLLSIALLVAAAASLVGHLHRPYSDILWWAGSGLSLVSLALQAVGWKLSEARDTSW